MEKVDIDISIQYITQPINIPLSNEIEYNLKQNYFDPSKLSPPDNFIEKLEIRMQHYYNSLSKDTTRDTKYLTK
jgi:hypothetical protein